MAGKMVKIFSKPNPSPLSPFPVTQVERLIFSSTVSSVNILVSSGEYPIPERTFFRGEKEVISFSLKMILPDLEG